MKLKYYLRGLGIGIIMTALIIGPVSAQKVDGASAGEENKAGEQTLAEYADNNQNRDPEDNLDNEKNEADNHTEISEGTVTDGGAGSEEEPETPENVMPLEELPKIESPQEDDEMDEAGKKAAEEAVENVGAGKPLSERIEAFSESEVTDAPGTRETRAANSNANNNSNSNSNTNSNNSGSTSGNSGSNNSGKTDNSGSSAGSSPSSGRTTEVSSYYTVSIYPGEGSYTVSRKLAALDLVEGADIYDSFLCQNGYDKRLRTGNFNIKAGSSPEEIAKIITGNPVQ